MSLDDDLEFSKRYAAASPADQRRALYGRAMFELTKFIKEHAAEYEDVDALMDAAQPEFDELVRATLGLLMNATEEQES